MKAFGLVSFDVPAAVIEVPAPPAGPGEVLVRVSASSVNNFDVGVASGVIEVGGRGDDVQRVIDDISVAAQERKLPKRAVF